MWARDKRRECPQIPADARPRQDNRRKKPSAELKRLAIDFFKWIDTSSSLKRYTKEIKMSSKVMQAYTESGINYIRQMYSRRNEKFLRRAFTNTRARTERAFSISNAARWWLLSYCDNFHALWCNDHHDLCFRSPGTSRWTAYRPRI